MSCECYKIGGPWIAEDPSCPLHGADAFGREQRIEDIVKQAVAGELTPSEATTRIMDDYNA